MNRTAPMILSVTQLNTYIRSVFEQDPHLTQVFVTGEISNFKNYYRSGHLYLSLKDDKSIVKAVMFARYAQRLRFMPEDGMKVIARGSVSVYEASGQYQLYIEDLQPDGVGALSVAFEQLKKKLESEGLFSNKKPIPKFPETIGVVTSPSGAAVRDIFTVLGRRYPAAQIVFCPVAVQGRDAAPQIAEAVGRFNRLRCADVLIVGRGGGSLEDLWPFNEEIVARAVAASEIPVISAVGHETDFTICDFAADLRAPTPSAAAELAVPDQTELVARLDHLNRRFRQSMETVLSGAGRRMDRISESRVFRNPLERLELRRIEIDRLTSAFQTGLNRQLECKKSLLASASGRLNAMSPLAVLSRGYALACGENGNPLSRASEARQGQSLTLKMNDGDLDCKVEKVTIRRKKRSEAGKL
ncbi:exodeoxyribonuclease VII large subunit [Caproiciproducens sp. NJN-50]|uniref:exodeoxyribonuclease VII large subunit n=1 Tax=Acutalibacteraceae TaxID=3082771 RepID=UPI000FFE277C|nr:MULTISPECIES: exodeoxyribonuclease VII large subunit [Acutalibacteraceae]QAT49671.1 exodeoxyribonuclease VII large subunit [Caproiciproducens sp. NJN-50]